MSNVLGRIGALRNRYVDPMVAIDWTSADPALPWLPLRMLSRAGLGRDAEIAPDLLVRLSRIEFARLCAAGLWLEGLLISRATSRGFPAHRPAEARAILQEVREETGHGLMFLEMIDRAGLGGVALLGPTGLLSAVAHRLSPEDAAFWAMVFVGETVTDQYALRALHFAGANNGAADRRLCPVARQVLALHHRDEARHIAAARALLDARVQRMGPSSRRLFAVTLRFLLRRFLRATLYPTAASLALLGLADPREAARAAWACPERRALARNCAAPALEFLRGLSLAEPKRNGRAAREGGEFRRWLVGGDFKRRSFECRVPDSTDHGGDAVGDQ
jgi:hypothetical protein